VPDSSKEKNDISALTWTSEDYRHLYLVKNLSLPNALFAFHNLLSINFYTRVRLKSKL
jgi:hypothetical protein